MFAFQLESSASGEPHMVTCMVNSVKVRMTIDSGADVNTIGEDAWAEMLANHVNGERDLSAIRWGNGRNILHAYAAKEPLRIEASFDAEISISNGKRLASAKFFVIRGAAKSLLGRTTAMELGVLRMGLELNACELELPEKEEQVVTEFPCAPGPPVHFDIELQIDRKLIR
jgi:hypothetical protein